MANQLNSVNTLVTNRSESQLPRQKKIYPDFINTVKPYLLVAAVLTVNNLVYNTLFIILGAMATQRNYDERQIGFLGSAFLVGQLVSNLSGVLWVNKVNWRFAVGGSAIAGALFIAASAHAGYSMLICFYLLAGSMTGVALSCMFCHMSGMDNPVRAYSVSLIMQCLVAGSVIIILQSFVLPNFGFTGLSYTIAAMCLIALIAAPFLPKGITTTAQKNSQNHITDSNINSCKGSPISSKKSLLSIAGLAAISIYFLGQTSIWAFIERIGDAKGFSADAIGTISASVLILCALGAWAANQTALRLGKLVPIAIGISGFIVAILTLHFSNSKVAYFLSFLLYASAWNYILPYQLLMVSQDQKYSVYASVIPAFQSIGASAGPAMVGILVVNSNSYLPAYLLSIGTALTSLLIFSIIFLKTKKHSAAL